MAEFKPNGQGTLFGALRAPQKRPRPTYATCPECEGPSGMPLDMCSEPYRMAPIQGHTGPEGETNLGCPCCGGRWLGSDEEVASARRRTELEDARANAINYGPL